MHSFWDAKVNKTFFIFFGGDAAWTEGGGGNADSRSDQEET